MAPGRIRSKHIRTSSSRCSGVFFLESYHIRKNDWVCHTQGEKKKIQIPKTLGQLKSDTLFQIRIMVVVLREKEVSVIYPRVPPMFHPSRFWEYISTSFLYKTFIIAPAAAAAKSLQSCPTLCDPIDGSLPGSPVPGILQARTLEWVAISFSSA